MSDGRGWVPEGGEVDGHFPRIGNRHKENVCSCVHSTAMPMPFRDLRENHQALEDSTRGVCYYSYNEADGQQDY